MKVRGDDLIARMILLGARIALGKAVSCEYIRTRFHVSVATAKRDMHRLEAAMPLKVALKPREIPGRRARELSA